MVDSGTSGIGVPPSIYNKFIKSITDQLKTCKDLTCVGKSPSQYPILLFTLAPDNVLPILPNDYLQCTGKFNYI
jgi:hypothetical protein